MNQTNMQSLLMCVLLKMKGYKIDQFQRSATFGHSSSSNMHLSFVVVVVFVGFCRSLPIPTIILTTENPSIVKREVVFLTSQVPTTIRAKREVIEVSATENIIIQLKF